MILRDALSQMSNVFMSYAVRKLLKAAYPDPRIFTEQVSMEEDVKMNNTLGNENELPPAQEEPSLDPEHPKNIQIQKFDDFPNCSYISRKPPAKESNRMRHNALPPIEHSSNPATIINKQNVGLIPPQPSKAITERRNSISKGSFHPHSPAQESKSTKKEIRSGEGISETLKKEQEQKNDQPICVGDVIMLETRKGHKEAVVTDSEYTAVLGGDSITSQSMYTLGRSVSTQWAAENYIKQSLFRVECKLNYTKAAYLEHMQKMISHFPDKDDKIKWTNAVKEVKNEEQTNEAELGQKKGTPVQYGQVIQLHHLFTRDYVTVAIHEISKEGGAQKVELGKGSERAWLQFMPGTKTAKIGDLVRYGETILVMSKADQDNCYLRSGSCSLLSALDPARPLQDNLPNSNLHISEVNASVQSSNWKARRCTDFHDLETKENVLKVGDIFKLYHVNTESYLTLSKKDTCFQLMRGLKENPQGASLELYLTNMQDNEAALCWQLEKVEDYLGGIATWEGSYKLRHVLTGMYLTYSIKGEFKLEDGQGIKKSFIQMHPLNVVVDDEEKQIVDQMYLALMIRGGVIVPPQTGPEEIAGTDKTRLKEVYEEKLVFKERSGPLSSNCVYQIQKLSKTYENRVRQGKIFFDNFFYYEHELHRDTIPVTKRSDIVFEPDRAPKHSQRPTHSSNTSVVLSELFSKVELLLDVLCKSEEQSLQLLKNTQTSFCDTFNIDSLILLLQVLETKFVGHDFLRTRERSNIGYLYRFDLKVKQLLPQAFDLGNPLTESYLKLSKLVYQALYKISVGNKKASTTIIGFAKILSGEVYQFNKEICKLLGSAIPCAMPFVQSSVDHVTEWFKLLAPIVKTQNYNNITDQLVALKVLRGLCLGNDGKGNTANQRTCFKLLQESASIFLGFGIEESRPYVSFNQSDKIDQDFLNNNPVLATYSRTLDSAKDAKVLCVYLDDLSKNHKTTIDYICYVAHVLKLFSAMCVGRFNAGIAELVKRGLVGYHLVSCLKMNVPRLHPKLMQAYLELTKVICIDVDPLTSILNSPNRCYFWEDFNKEDNFSILSQEDNRLEEPSERELMYRISDIRYTFEEYLGAGPQIGSSGKFLRIKSIKIDTADSCRQNLKIVYNWLSICKGLLEYRQVTSEFLEKIIQFTVHILSTKEDTPYSSIALIKFSNSSGRFGWIKALLEQAKIANKDQIKLLKEIALEILVLVHHIKSSLQLIAFLKSFKREFAAGYTPHESGITLHDIKTMIADIFADTKVEFPKVTTGANSQLASAFFQVISPVPRSKSQTTSVSQVPLDLTLLGLIFEENRGFTGINDKAMAALTMSFGEQQKLIEELTKVDIVVSEEDTKLYLDLLKEKRLARIFIDNVLNQNTIFAKTEKTAQKKKTIADLQELLQRVMAFAQPSESKRKTQNFMYHLKFHVDLMGLLQVAAIDPGLINNLLETMVSFLFLFCQGCPTNQNLLVPYATQLLGLHKYGIKVSKLLHQIFAYNRSQKEEKWLIDYLLNELQAGNEQPNPDIMRLLAALADSVAEKHSKYILKSLLALKMQKYIMMNLDESKRKQALIYKWKRDPKGLSGLLLKTHIYMISTIGNCAEHSEYGKIQGRKLVTEEDIVASLLGDTTTFMLKMVYIRLYYSLYIHKDKTAETSKAPPKALTSILKVVLEDLKKFNQYEDALESLYKKRTFLDFKAAMEEENLPNENLRKSFEDAKEISGFSNYDNQKFVVARNQKRDDDFEYMHKPGEYWKMLAPRKKIEADKGGLLNFLSETFSLHSWDLTEDIFALVLDIRAALMEIYDALYKIQDDKNEELNLEELSFMICRTIEGLPASIKYNEKAKPSKVEMEENIEVEEEENAVKGERSESEINVIPSDTRRELKETSKEEKYKEVTIKEQIEEQDDLVLRQKENYEFVIEAIKKYIMDNNLTIREAFKLFDTNVDQKIDRLELKKSIKDICKTQVTYLQIEDTIEYIERTVGPGNSSGALAFAEFSTTLKKALKRAQYKNYKPKLEEISDVQLEDQDPAYSAKINISLKHFIIDYKRCIDYFPDDLQLAELSYKISSIIHYLLRKNKVADISILISRLIRTFDKDLYQDCLIDIFKTILLSHREEYYSNPSKQNQKRLSNIVKIFIREPVLSTALNLLTSNYSLSLNKEACGFLNTLLELCQDKQDNSLSLEAQQAVLNHLAKTKRYEEIFRRIRRVFESCMRKLKKKYVPEQINIYDKSLFLSNLNLSQTIEKIDRVGLFSYTKSLLHLLRVLSENSFTNLQEFFRTQVVLNSLHETASVNLLNSTGLLLISLTELDSDLYTLPNYYRLLPYIFTALTQMCTGNCTGNQVYLGNWVKFVRCLNFFITKPIPWSTEADEELVKQQSFSCVVQLLNSLLSEESAGSVAKTILNELDIWSLRWKLSEIYREKLLSQEQSYIDDMVCDHDSEDKRTCTPYFCSYGYLAKNDKTIIKTAFDAFIFLNKLKELYPDHPSIQDFAVPMSKSRVVARGKKAFVANNAQVLPIKKNMSDTIPDNNVDYSILTDTEDFSSARPELSPSQKQGCFKRAYTWLLYSSSYSPNRNKICCRNPQVEEKAETQITKSDVRQLVAMSLLEGIIAKQRNINPTMRLTAGATILSKLKRHEQLEREHKKADIVAAEEYYRNNVRSVEIFLYSSFFFTVNSNNKLEKVYFPVPTYCRYITSSMQRKTVVHARNESQQTKLQDMALDASIYKKLLKHQQRLSRITPLLRMLTVWLTWMKNGSLLLAFLINFLLLLLYTKTNGDTKEINATAATSIKAFGILQAILSVCIIAVFTLKNIPAFTTFSSDTEESKFMKKLWGKVRSYRIRSFSGLFFWGIYVAISVLGLVNWLAYPFLLLYIVPRWSVLWNIVCSLSGSFKQIVQASVLIIVIIYLYAVWGFQYLNNSFIFANGADNCENLLDCFATSFNRGLRSFGGIGDVLADNDYPHESELYWGRYWYDLTAFLLINGLLLCLLWGIVMNALSEMQRRRTAVHEEMNSVCYLCGINKFEIETKGRGWKKHIMEEHSVTDYICYLNYIDQKEKEDLNALEIFVKKRKEVNAVDYFPIGKARSVLGSASCKQNENSEEIKHIVAELRDQIKEIKANMIRNDTKN